MKVFSAPKSTFRKPSTILALAKFILTLSPFIISVTTRSSWLTLPAPSEGTSISNTNVEPVKQAAVPLTLNEPEAIAFVWQAAMASCWVQLLSASQVSESAASAVFWFSDAILASSELSIFIVAWVYWYSVIWPVLSATKTLLFTWSLKTEYICRGPWPPLIMGLVTSNTEKPAPPLP